VTIAVGDGHDDVSFFGASSRADIGVFSGTLSDTFLARGVTVASSFMVRLGSGGAGGGPGFNSAALLTSSAIGPVSLQSDGPANLYLDTVFSPSSVFVGNFAPVGLAIEYLITVVRCDLGKLNITGSGLDFTSPTTTFGDGDQIRVMGNRLGLNRSSAITGHGVEFVAFGGPDQIEVTYNVVNGVRAELGDDADVMDVVVNIFHFDSAGPYGLFVDGGGGIDTLNLIANQNVDPFVVNVP
jgi:hypothetical protein